MPDRKKILIVGAGLAGATVARTLADAGHEATVIDRRKHVAGNAFDFKNEHGIRVHKYGPHIFHTKMQHVWLYLSQFTSWLEYKHRVKARLDDGRYVTLPINRDTRAVVGSDRLIDVLVRPYSKKMWGLDIEQLDPSVLKRLPMRDDDSDVYFPDDQYEGMPTDGYSVMVERMLDSPNIRVLTGEAFSPSMEQHYDRVFSSMAIDEYYGYRFDDLPYRSLKFHVCHAPLERIFPTPVVNFTHEGPYTRVAEWKNFPGHGTNKYVTTLTYEEPCDYRDNDMERYYPVKDVAGKNRENYLKYLAIPNQKVEFIGRCGLYTYTDMDGAVSMALNAAKRYLNSLQ